MLDPKCPSCGGTLRPLGRDEHARLGPEDEPAHGQASRRVDGTAMFALLLAGPWLLPLVGVKLGDLVFVAPAVLLSFAAQRLVVAAVRRRELRAVVGWLAAAASCAATASTLAVVDSVLDGSLGFPAFYLGAGGSLALLAAATLLVRAHVDVRRWSRLVDAALLGIVVVGLIAVFLVVPGFTRGDAMLTSIVVVDVAALSMAGFAAVVRSRGEGRGEWWLVLACLAALAGDGIVAAAATDGQPVPSLAVALMWGLAGFALATTTEHGLGRDGATAPVRGTGGARLLWWRVVVPLFAVLALPATAVAMAVAGTLSAWEAVWFAALAVTALALAFGRQAHLLAERHRTVVRERRLREDVTRRNEELEALTGLATTMTQTLEEAPIVEQALGVLHTAARATSAALHVATEDGDRLAAAAGAWLADREWAPRHAIDDVELTERGRRVVLRLPLAARGHRIGTVALVRPHDRPFDPQGIGLLRLLVDQMAVAVQNARDYREKLDQAIRDPLTGLYNRRFLLEALEKEVQRAARYDAEMSLVLFDVDDFKSINDQHGHATGDAVLREIARVVEEVVRPSDSFARIGGEEFALLLPGTTQLEALLVADRARLAIARSAMLGDRRVTVSGGVASCPADGVGADELQRRADAALYWAKRNGKDLCAVASEATEDAGEEAAHDGMVAHLYAMVAMIDAAHLHTRDHSENVAAYASAIGQELGLERDRLIKLRRAALLHDIGKVAVRSDILAKPGRLTDEEFAAIREHPVVGATMVAHAGLADEALWVRHHHERVDGTGYPDRVSGEDLALEARILFVADAFEAMTSDRPYSSGVAVEDALDELRRCAGTQFDPQVVAAFEHLVTSGRLPVLALLQG